MSNKSRITRDNKIQLVIARAFSDYLVYYSVILMTVNNPQMHLLVKLKQFDFTNKCFWGFFVSIKKEELV